MCEQYKELVRRRYELLNKSRDLHSRVEKVREFLLVASLTSRLRRSEHCSGSRQARVLFVCHFSRPLSLGRALCMGAPLLR